MRVGAGIEGPARGRAVAGTRSRREVTPTSRSCWRGTLNRTPRRCGWSSAKGGEDTRSAPLRTRFADAWAAAYAAEHLETLEKKTRSFAAAIRESTIPGAIKDAATANLSTLVTQVCFRTSDGEFHGFEGANDHSGCCHGSCGHVWNYETATAHIFPSFARSLRDVSFGYDLDDAGAIRFREQLPHKGDRFNVAAADGQMGQIMHAYLDWAFGRRRMLRDVAASQEGDRVRVGAGGWDADRDGVLEGVQHNTYDVEFYGPNPMCGIFYLGALRAARKWRGRRATRRARRSIGRCSSGAANGSTVTCSTASFIFRRFAA